MNNKIVIGTVIGLIAGLMLGVFMGVLITSPSGILPSKTGAGTNNQVQVSGTIEETGISSIEFTNLNGTISSSAPIINGVYSILLVGGQSYNVDLFEQYGNEAYEFSLYVPLGVTTFAANF